MIYRKFGNTGIEISALGFGCMRLPEIEIEKNKWTIDFEKSTEMLRHAYELGVNYFDTAYYYCHSNSEEAVGKALKPFRDRVYISTKCPMDKISKKEDFEKTLDESLARLDTDYVDFYHFWSINKKVFEEKILGFGLIEEAKRLKAIGKIRHISFSFHDHPKYIQEIIDESNGAMETMLVQYNLLDRSNAKGIAYAQEKGMGVVAMGPVAGGRLAAPKALTDKLGVDHQIADYDLALRYVLENEGISCALSGMENLDMVNKNVEAISNSKKLSAEEKKIITRTKSLVKKFSQLYCTGCGYCQPCPKGIEIPRIFQAYTYKNVYGLDEMGKNHFDSYVNDKKKLGALVDKCVNCGFCEKKCPQKLKVRALLKKVEDTFKA